MSSASPQPAAEQRRDRLERLVDGVEHAGLVAVERLDGDRHAGRHGVLDDRREVLRAARRSTAARSPAVIRQVRPTEAYAGPPIDPRTHRRGGVDARPQVVLGGSARSLRRWPPARGPSPITSAGVAPSPSSSEQVRAAAGSQSPGFSTGSSITSNPQPATRGASAARALVVSGDVHTQVLTPSGRCTGVLLGVRRSVGRGTVAGAPGERADDRRLSGSADRVSGPATPRGSRAGPRRRTWRSAGSACPRCARGSRRGRPR